MTKPVPVNHENISGIIAGYAGLPDIAPPPPTGTEYAFMTPAAAAASGLRVAKGIPYDERNGTRIVEQDPNRRVASWSSHQCNLV